MALSLLGLLEALRSGRSRLQKTGWIESALARPKGREAPLPFLR
jgi:hypothetical protein